MKPKYIIIHHSLTKDSGTVSWSAIRSYHTSTLGWLDIGYHYGIEKVNLFGTYEIMLGRFPDEFGAHCVPRNKDSIGICLIGNFDEEKVPDRQWDCAVNLCCYLRRNFGILPHRILGHREAQENRTCPGKNFDMDKFRLDVQNKLWNKIG